MKTKLFQKKCYRMNSDRTHSRELKKDKLLKNGDVTSGGEGGGGG